MEMLLKGPWLGFSHPPGSDGYIVTDPLGIPAPPSGQTPTITSDALITAKACMPGFNPSSCAASLVIDAVIVTVGDTSIRTCVVVAPGVTALTVPAIWLRADSFIILILCQGERYFPAAQTRLSAAR